jgi:CTP synthase (UTP-ammonia lyase)
MKPSLAVVADFNPASKSHVATNEAIAHSAATLGLTIEPIWVSTLEAASPEGLKRLASFSGIWAGPCSPYKSMDGAMSAIRLAREQGIPLLGTCGGFQHLILEYARNVLGYSDANHEETSPGAARLFISRLACSLVGRSMAITFTPGSTLAGIYEQPSAEEEYICNFGVDPQFVPVLQSSALKIAASDAEGTVRAVELPDHPFFIGTLFLPQHRSTATRPHPLVTAFLRSLSQTAAPARLP